jgi:quercetin dioxygenase-like cupin family protein
MKILSAGLLVGVLCCVVSAQSPSQGVAAQNISDLKLQPLPDAPACFPAAVERGDPAHGSSIMIMRCSAGCYVPWHWHPASEEIMMTRGTAEVHVKGEKPIKLAAGGFLAVPPHHVMNFSCTSESQLFLLTGGAFEIHYVNDAGNEISPQEALATGRRSAAAKKK